MGHLTEDEHNTDWLDALAQDASFFSEVMTRVETLGIIAVQRLEKKDIAGALEKLAQMGEGIRLAKQLVGIK